MAQAAPIKMIHSSVDPDANTATWTAWGFVPVATFRTDVDATAVLAALGKTRQGGRPRV